WGQDPRPYTGGRRPGHSVTNPRGAGMSKLVVVGLGYVGLPLVQAAVRAGHEVVGLDVNERVVAALNAGRSHVDDLSDDEIAALLADGFTASSDEAVIGSADVVVVCVPTPLSPDGGPDLGAVTGATQA